MTVRRVAVDDFEAMMREGEIKDATTLAAWGLLRLGPTDTLHASLQGSVRTDHLRKLPDSAGEPFGEQRGHRGVDG